MNKTKKGNDFGVVDIIFRLLSDRSLSSPKKVTGKTLEELSISYTMPKGKEIFSSIIYLKGQKSPIEVMAELSEGDSIAAISVSLHKYVPSERIIDYVRREGYEPFVADIEINKPKFEIVQGLEEELGRKIEFKDLGGRGYFKLPRGVKNKTTPQQIKVDIKDIDWDATVTYRLLMAEVSNTGTFRGRATGIKSLGWWLATHPSKPYLNYWPKIPKVDFKVGIYSGTREELATGLNILSNESRRFLKYLGT